MNLTKKERILSAAFGFLIGTGYLFKAIFTSHSSTAALGIMFVPLYGGVGAALSIASYYLLKKDWYTRTAFVVVAAILTFGLYEKYENIKSASDENTPASYLIDLAQAKMLFGKEEVQQALAENTSSPASLLQKLADAGSVAVRLRVAANTSAPVELLQKFADENFDYSLHGSLAANTSLTPAALARLLSAKPSDFKGNDEYKLYQTYVFGPLARNPKLSEADFLKLTQLPNPEYFLIYGIIESGRASCELLKSYRDGDNGALKGNAQSRMTGQGCPL